MSTTIHEPVRSPGVNGKPSGESRPAPGVQPDKAGPATAERLVSLDAYRGFIMLAMASAFGAGFAGVLKGLPADDPARRFWDFLYGQFEHVPWAGCCFWDLIQPSFMFMVGVAMPYSYAARQARGDSGLAAFSHVLYRSLVLVALGIFLSSNGSRLTNYTFVNVLTQIGLGYGLVYLFLGLGFKAQLAGVVTILVGYGLFFVLGPTLEVADMATVGLKESWPLYEGWYASWNKNLNAAAWFDQWFLNLFPREKPFVFNDGGYQTLNFVPSMATMLFGLMAGELLRSERKQLHKLGLLLGAGVACLAVGTLLDLTVCPSVKRIWTPTWAVYSTGWTFLMLAAFYGVIDVAGLKAWSFPLVVVGMNSIAMYCMAQLVKGWVGGTLRTHTQAPFQAYKDSLPDSWQPHLGATLFQGTYGPLLQQVLVLTVLWLVCLWMYRRKLFLKI